MTNQEEHYREICTHCGGEGELVSYSVARCTKCKAVWGVRWI